MNKNDSLRFKVSVSPVYADLYKQLEEAGPYYRSRLMLNLAVLGLSLSKGHSIKNLPTIQPQTKSETLNDNDQIHYTIPENAGDALEQMLGSFFKD